MRQEEEERQKEGQLEVTDRSWAVHVIIYASLWHTMQAKCMPRGVNKSLLTPDTTLLSVTQVYLFLSCCVYAAPSHLDLQFFLTYIVSSALAHPRTHLDSQRVCCRTSLIAIQNSDGHEKFDGAFVSK